MSISATVIGGKKIKEWAAIARHPLGTNRGRLARTRVRKRVTREFSRSAGENRTGGTTPWVSTKPFGNKPATRPTGGGADSPIPSAFRGGPGGSSSIGPDKLTFRINLPFAVIHRRGGLIPITKPSRGLVGAVFGVYPSKGKKFWVIPARPYADMAAPGYADDITSVIVEGLDGVTG